MSELGERFLKYVMSVEKDSMKIKFHQMDSGGQVSFAFPLEDIEDEELRVEIDVRQKNILSAVGPFYVNMIGQMVVRRNLSAFFEFYRDMSDEDYSTKLSSMEYVSFGMGCKNGYVTMVFHSSLLYNVFTALLSNTTEDQAQ